MQLCRGVTITDGTSTFVMLVAAMQIMEDHTWPCQSPTGHCRQRALQRVTRPRAVTGKLVEVDVVVVGALCDAGAVHEAILGARAVQSLQHKRRKYVLQCA